MSRRTFSALLAVCIMILFAISPGTVRAEDPPGGPVAGASMPGFLYDVGTHFEVTGSDYLDVVVDSSASITLTVESMAEAVNLHIEPSTTATSTVITVGGLLPNTTYYKYIDDFHDPEVIITDALGRISFTQDITAAHIVFIVTRHSTLFIADDATGGDCTSVGIWDAGTKTCTLTKDLNDSIEIDDNNIILDGNGHTLDGSGAGWIGVYVNGGWYVTVRNINITKFGVGLRLSYAYYCTVENSSFYANTGGGIHLFPYNYYNTVANNMVTGNLSTGMSLQLWPISNEFRNNYVAYNRVGISTLWIAGNHFQNNTIENNTQSGLVLDGSSSNIVEDSIVRNNGTGVRAMDYYGSARWNSILRNTIENNALGLDVRTSDTTVYQNNVVDNDVQIQTGTGVNHFSAAPPVGGNYWSDYDTTAEGCFDTDVDGLCDAPYAFTNGQDDYPHVAMLLFNQFPVADAGLDQFIECPGSLTVPVTLDASGSYDLDGDALTYSWVGPFGTASGVNPTVTLPWWGSYTIPLIVEDPYGASGMDRVTITAIDSIPPVTTATVIGTKDVNDTYISDVTVILSAEDECTGVGEIHYTINNEPAVVVADATETTFTLTEDGTYLITYWSVDNNGLMGLQHQATVNATPSVGGGGSGGGGGGGGGGLYCIDLDLIQDSGQGELVYSLDGGQTWEVYTSSVSVCNETPTVSITYGYVAPSNNVEQAKTLFINIQKTSLGLILPGNISVPATSNQGAVVTYNASATGATSFSCSPASGSLFPLGTTTVSCTASDAEGNSTNGSFTITVQDITPPVLSLPSDITAEATGPDGAAVTFAASATDNLEGSVPVTCTPASGSMFPIGATQVNCSASDSYGNTASGSIMVIVQDTTPPALTCPGDISVLLGTPPTDPAITEFLAGATATDVVDLDVALVNEAPSAYDTPGPVTVTFTATDDFSNSSSCSATISVQYGFGGFLQPVSLLKPFHFGSTVPVKFQLTDYSGAYVSTAQAVLGLVQVSGTEPSGVPIEGTTNVPDSGNVFRYDTTDNQYIYNLATDLGQLSVGTWNIVVTLDDGTTRSIEFKLK